MLGRLLSLFGDDSCWSTMVNRGGFVRPTLNDPPRDPRDEAGPLTPPSIVSRPESPYTLCPPIDFDGLSWPCK